MRTRNAVNHDVLAFAQRFVEEAVGRLKVSDHLLRRVELLLERNAIIHLCFHDFADSVLKVSEAFVVREAVLTLTSLSIYDVEDLMLLKNFQVL